MWTPIHINFICIYINGIILQIVIAVIIVLLKYDKD
jgi:hypothetical protein